MHNLTGPSVVGDDFDEMDLSGFEEGFDYEDEDDDSDVDDY